MYPPLGKRMIKYLHLVPDPFTLMKWAVWLFMIHPTLCVHNGSSLEAAPISFPPSETWYVILAAVGLLQLPFISLLSLV